MECLDECLSSSIGLSVEKASYTHTLSLSLYYVILENETSRLVLARTVWLART
jgi:hypothetical protein